MAKAVRRRRWKATEEADFRKMWADGVSSQTIARLFNRTLWAINRRARDLKLEPRKRGFTEAEDAEFEARCRSLVEALCADYKRTPSAVATKLVSVLFALDAKAMKKKRGIR